MVEAATRHGFSCCALKPSQSMERYLKVIYLLSFTDRDVSTSVVAGRMGVAAPSVSAMLRRLDAADLLATGPAIDGIVLNPHGESHARSVIRRHRLIETFLVRAVGMSWDEVHVEAEALEHAASDVLIDRIDAALGHPRHDPHGDPIPQPSGPHSELWSPPLSNASPGTSFRVDRVSDEDSAALRHLADIGIVPGVTLKVVQRDPFEGPLWVEHAGRRHALGIQLARAVHGISLS